MRSPLIHQALEGAARRHGERTALRDGGEDWSFQALAAAKLASYKHLREIEIVDTIPRLPSGKVLRRTLRAEMESRKTTPSRE